MSTTWNIMVMLKITLSWAAECICITSAAMRQVMSSLSSRQDGATQQYLLQFVCLSTSLYVCLSVCPHRHNTHLERGSKTEIRKILSKVLYENYRIQFMQLILKLPFCLKTSGNKYMNTMCNLHTVTFIE